jgi:hypothetical protein
MRLSWYADTGVAVFSIWQGGMCTGTFRLAIGDLPRMVETLQRGPGGQASGPDPATGGPGLDDFPADVAGRIPGLEPLPRGGAPAEYQPGQPPYEPGWAPEQHAGQADYRTQAGEYVSGRPDPLSRPAHHLTRENDVSRARSDDTASAGPPDYADPLDTSRRWDEPYPGTRPRAPYPAATAHASYYPGHPDPLYPEGDPGGLRPRGSASPGGLADDPYLAGTGPVDFPAEPTAAHYPPATSLPGHEGGTGRSSADYQGHYGTADSDDIAPGPPPETFPYGQPPGNRGPRRRHPDPDHPFG